MPKIKYVISLTEEERKELTAIKNRGKHTARKVINALILLKCDKGKFQSHHYSDPEIEKMLEVSNPRIWRVKKTFVEEGMEVALNGHKGKRIYERCLDGEAEAHLIALSCGDPPEGYARWSVRLLADKMVELNYVDSVSPATVFRTLKKMNLNLGKTGRG
jgi:biotin operon repressor